LNFEDGGSMSGLWAYDSMEGASVSVMPDGSRQEGNSRDGAFHGMVKEYDGKALPLIEIAFIVVFDVVCHRECTPFAHQSHLRLFSIHLQRTVI